MGSYSIGEAADRTGFTTSTLRYYEGRGLVVPSARTASGYRVYDDHDLERLAFIARAKQLGCSLEEIVDLTAVWDGERCGPVQRRLHELITSKMSDTRTQIAELTSLGAQLQQAAEQLAGPAVDGRCGEDCACMTGATVAGERVAVPLVAKPEDAPIACTLDAGAQPERVAAWAALLEGSTPPERTAVGSLRIELNDPADLDELVRLVAAEQACCAFFSFSITVDQRGVGLEVRAPRGADEIVTALFGASA